MCPEFCTDAKPYKHTQTLALRKVGGIVRKISLMVRLGSNPHHSWLGLTEQQNLTLFRGRAWMPEVERPKFRKDAKQTERSLKGKGDGVGRGVVRFGKGWSGARRRGCFISFSIITYVFTKRRIHSVSPDRSIHVSTASMPNKRSFRSYSRRLLYQSYKGAVYSLFQTQASVCRTAV